MRVRGTPVQAVQAAPHTAVHNLDLDMCALLIDLGRTSPGRSDREDRPVFDASLFFSRTRCPPEAPPLHLCM